MNPLIHVFVGPSLPPSAQPALQSVVYHGPASQGDVYSLVSSRPMAIALIDGYFERVPAVWHKEILWALAQGVHVFGASSMGALRAAELADFGMVGVGAVFEDFASGRLQDDDEVTLVHADASEDFRPGSEAMVNLRATLTRACQEGVLSAPAAVDLTAYAKSLFYPDRDYARLMARAKERLPAADASALRDWLRIKSHRVDVKRRDSLQLLSTLRQFLESQPAPQQVPWTFQHTDAWEQVRSAVSRAAVGAAYADDVTDAIVLRQLEASPGAQRALQDEAALRGLRARAAKRAGFVVTEPDRTAVLQELMREHGIRDSQELAKWLQQQCLTEFEYDRLLDDEVCARRGARLSAFDARSELLDLLRISGRYGRLRAECETVVGAPLKAAE
jgi:hypothetical protein